MKRRTSILLDDGLYRRVVRRASEEGTTVTEQVRVALEEHLGDSDESDEDWLEGLIGIGASGGKFPPIESGEAKDQMARDMWRRNMNREPDW